MNHRRIVFAAVLLLIAGIVNAYPARADKEPQLGKFSSILRKGQAIYLRVSTNSPFYTVQLLTDEQAEQVRKARADAASKLKELAEIESKLKTEKKLEVRATLFLKQDQLNSEIRLTRLGSRLTRSTYYEVQWAAGDYVAIKSSGVVKYIPFRSIISIEKRDALVSARGLPDRGFRGSRSQTVATEHRIRLQVLKAGPVAEVIKKSFPGEKFEIEASINANTIIVKALPLVARRIEQLVQRLDVDVQD